LDRQLIKMEATVPLFMTCDELREAFAQCPNDINKRILIIDVRDETLYRRSHLCLDSRNSKDSIIRKMRVININPDSLKFPTAKQIMSILSEDDLKIFKKRKDATEVVIIDSNTDSVFDLLNPKSKSMRIISALTKWDSQPDDKIIVPIHILKGGYREWLLKYPHFTTNPSFNPDAEPSDFQSSPAASIHSDNSPRSANSESPSPNVKSPAQPQIVNTPSAPPRPYPLAPPLQLPSNPPYVANSPSAISGPSPTPLAISKPVPTPPKVVTASPRPNVVKNAPGTAVPVTPIFSLKPSLPRSRSSPNVAQADGDELSGPLNKFDRPALTRDKANSESSNRDNGLTVPPSQTLSKPRFDRALKPAINSDLINAIRAKINFGRSPEASGKAITGLQNLGNTCFMNSVIQCLAYSPSLVSYFCSDTYYNHINFFSQYGSKGELAIEFGALVEKLNSHRHRYIEPKSFREAIIKHIGFVGNEQQDSHEFMMMLFDKLHHDLNVHTKDKLKQNGIVSQNCSSNEDNNINIPRATLGYQFWRKHLEMNKSIISDLFEGIFMSTLTCTFCKGQSNTFEVFNCLSLPIPSETRCHVRDCLSHFSNPERIEAAWECPRCKQKREVDKKIVICKLPRILIIHLKRFSLDGRWRQKLQTTVEFPLTDLNVDYTNVLPQSAYGPTFSKSAYNLCAVVNHYGHLDGGHYTAFTKLENQRWYTFDDGNVTEMKDTDVISQAAYILFYGTN